FAYFDLRSRLSTRRTSDSPAPIEQPQDEPNAIYRAITQLRTIQFHSSCHVWDCVAKDDRWIYLLLGLFLPGAAYGLSRTRWWRRRRLARRDDQHHPPYRWPVFRYAPPLPRYRGLLMRTADALRLRMAGDTDELDVPRTIDATIERAGFPTLVLRAGKR